MFIDLYQTLLFFIYLAMGLAFGSFLNVCILRIPSGESIVHPPSHCPQCLKPIKWWDNIPLVSYIFLGGRCRYCRKGISWQYPLVEALTGALFFLAYWKFNQAPVQLVAVAGLAIMSVLVSGIDIRTYTIPDRIIIPFLVFSVLLAPFNSFLGDHWVGDWAQAPWVFLSVAGHCSFWDGWVENSSGKKPWEAVTSNCWPPWAFCWDGS